MAEDIRRCAELASRVRLPEGRTIYSARVRHFLADDVPLVDPIGAECERLGAYAVVVIEN